MVYISNFFTTSGKPSRHNHYISYRFFSAATYCTYFKKFFYFIYNYHSVRKYVEDYFLGVLDSSTNLLVTSEMFPVKGITTGFPVRLPTVIATPLRP